MDMKKYISTYVRGIFASVLSPKLHDDDFCLRNAISHVLNERVYFVHF